MAAIELVATNTLELLKGTVSFLTNAANFGTGNEWTLMRPATVGDITDEAILKGVGDGQDEIYIGFKLQAGAGTEQKDILLNGFAGFDEYLAWEEQPGAINHEKLPTLPLTENTRIVYWISANTSRVIIVAQLSTQYESAYLGFIKPVAVERQYPYPMAIGGSYIEGSNWANQTPGHSCFVNPGSDTFAGLGNLATSVVDSPTEQTSSLRLRRPDGSWRSAINKINKNNVETATHFEHLSVWPQNTEPTNVLTVLDSTMTIENIIMFPCLLYETYPAGVVGQFDGVYFVGNREDLSSKDIIIHDSKPYMVFSNVFRRENDEYFVIEWF